MKILVTGANGQLGQELIRFNFSQPIIGLAREELDITKIAQIETAIKNIKPAIIINTAAYTAVDKAEQEQAQAFNINCEGVANLARCCNTRNIFLIHLSTDYVFAGDSSSPYREDALTNPLNIYGQSKLAGERAIQALMDNYLILRLSGIFSEYGNNFVKTILRLAKQQEILSIVNDIITCPTATKDIADVLMKICDFIQLNPKKKHTGIYHFCSSEPVSWYQFADTIINEAKRYQTLQVQKIQVISSAVYSTPARRPAYSVLDTHKLQQHFAININSWRLGLAEILPRLAHDKL